MISVSVSQRDHEKKLDRFLKEHFERLPQSTIFKAIRKRDIRVNGVRVSQNIPLEAGDQLDIYIKDELLYGLPMSGQTSGKSSSLEIVYEDSHLLLVNKQPGIPVHPDKDPGEPTLIDMAKEYLQEKGVYHPGKPGSFTPSLCHRLDRNTGGIVIIAKTAAALQIMQEKIKSREIKKFYKCMVQGCPIPLKAELHHYIIKDERKSQVFVIDKKQKGALEIITRYNVLSPGEEMSLVEVELITGRTHQIRAHLAYIGHPVVGDGKYGTNQFNRRVGAKRQALWAYKVVFAFSDGGVLQYLKGKTFETKNINFHIKHHT